MQFAKVFDVNGHQLLCLLQPRDEDGLPELKMVTWVGGTCVVFGNRLVQPGATIDDPAALLAKTRELFEGFGQAEAEQAYRAAQQVIESAERERAEHSSDREGIPGAIDPELEAALHQAIAGVKDADFGVPVVSTALH